jgi:hypothetical protein
LYSMFILIPFREAAVHTSSTYVADESRDEDPDPNSLAARLTW